MLTASTAPSAHCKPTTMPATKHKFTHKMHKNAARVAPAFPPVNANRHTAEIPSEITKAHAVDATMRASVAAATQSQELTRSTGGAAPVPAAAE